ncbi:MAG TPA: glycogen synthase GlgA [bacterium]|nr:glycogen synthase GlgA [bacterium]
MPRIYFCTSEAVPFAKTGGLADVAGALPAALAEAGCDVRIALPGYRAVDRGKFNFRTIGTAEVPLGSGRVTVEFLESRLPHSDARPVPVYLVAHEPSFGRAGLYGEGGKDYDDNLERFTVFGRGVLALPEHLRWAPDVMHCQDWQTGLLPVWLREEPRSSALDRTATLFTIHNLAYQGLFSPEQLPVTGLGPRVFTPRGIEFYGKVNLLKGGLVYADRLSTVSEQYAREIQTPEFGCGLEGVLRERAADLVGILNGVDYGAWDPSADPHIAARYTPDDLSGKAACKRDLQRSQRLVDAPKTPLVGMIGRLADQKGFDLVAAVLERLVAAGAQFVLLGTGEPKYHELFQAFHERYAGRVAVTLGFDDALAHRIEAGSDIFLMPSRYEPSGLNQLYSLRYGTVPVVRRTGGLADTIVDAAPDALARGTANGFVFDAYEPAALWDALERAMRTFGNLRVWRQLQQTGMRQDFSWRRAAARYVEAYRRAIDARRAGARA